MPFCLFHQLLLITGSLRHPYRAGQPRVRFRQFRDPGIFTGIRRHTFAGHNRGIACRPRRYRSLSLPQVTHTIRVALSARTPQFAQHAFHNSVAGASAAITSALPFRQSPAPPSGISAFRRFGLGGPGHPPGRAGAGRHGRIQFISGTGGGRGSGVSAGRHYFRPGHSASLGLAQAGHFALPGIIPDRARASWHRASGPGTGRHSGIRRIASGNQAAVSHFRARRIRRFGHWPQPFRWASGARAQKCVPGINLFTIAHWRHTDRYLHNRIIQAAALHI